MTIVQGIGYVFLAPGFLITFFALVAAIGGATSGGTGLLLGVALVIFGLIFVKLGGRKKKVTIREYIIDDEKEKRRKIDEAEQRRRMYSA